MVRYAGACGFTCRKRLSRSVRRLFHSATSWRGPASASTLAPVSRSTSATLPTRGCLTSRANARRYATAKPTTSPPARTTSGGAAATSLLRAAASRLTYSRFISRATSSESSDTRNCSRASATRAADAAVSIGGRRRSGCGAWRGRFSSASAARTDASESLAMDSSVRPSSLARAVSATYAGSVPPVVPNDSRLRSTSARESRIALTAAAFRSASDSPSARYEASSGAACTRSSPPASSLPTRLSESLRACCSAVRIGGGGGVSVRWRNALSRVAASSASARCRASRRTASDRDSGSVSTHSLSSGSMSAA